MRNPKQRFSLGKDAAGEWLKRHDPRERRQKKHRRRQKPENRKPVGLDSRAKASREPTRLKRAPASTGRPDKPDGFNPTGPVEADQSANLRHFRSI